MDIRKVKKLIEMLEESNLNEIEIKEGEESVKLVKAQVSSIKEQIVSSVNEAPKISSTENQDKKNSEMEKEEQILGKTVDSPMVGTFYGAPNPGADDFVSVGDKISEGDVLCIIEAMKMMNEVKSDFSGTVKQVLVENAEPVEFGQALFVVE
ncbi:MAG: acetyl-CoA carboxylase biotin carboxyl carrier protein [Gammaproteobacteria bacterium]|nr:MAG: acetyl-CoA carboxylase biotin carboxyl carrier protein [Gammaproteobacteria bacterium]|tara:strand:+ start:91 stop:546 length:456 start_codon:yes stop_codon:yes gene_type:complete